MDLACWILFFFKQKTSYEMRISDWSSDVCSSDLVVDRQRRRRSQPAKRRLRQRRAGQSGTCLVAFASITENATAICAIGGGRIDCHRYLDRCLSDQGGTNLVNRVFRCHLAGFDGFFRLSAYCTHYSR